ncbi:hypothetical protein QC764_507075 [Podospora pseudoanserina]|uniref:Uncharacterized protein n=1 Tax=Podospora pseudoanserina TaxID=2609844 RepID=A0ABR0I677_9PEZI|nr:hypothetical protein QC764_507075 [Podospora pseudoanserina]
MSDRPIIERTLKSLFPNKDTTREPFYLESLNLTIQDFITTKLKHTCRRHTSNISSAHLGAFLSKASAIDAVIRFHKGREGTLDGPFLTLSQCQQWFQAFSLQKMASANNPPTCSSPSPSGQKIAMISATPTEPAPAPAETSGAGPLTG